MDGSTAKNDRQQVAAYVDPQTKRAIERAAAREDRSVSSYVGRVLQQQIEIEREHYPETRSQRAAA